MLFRWEISLFRKRDKFGILFNMEKRTHYFDQDTSIPQEELFDKLDSERTQIGQEIVVKNNEFLKHTEPVGKFEFKEKNIHPWLLEKSQERLSNLMSKFGLQPKKIELGSIHFTQDKQSRLLHDGRSRGHLTPDANMVTVNLDVHNFIASIKTLTHELLHFNSFQTFKTEGNDKKEFKYQRVGLEVNNKLNFFNEGFTEYLANKDFYEYIQNDQNLKTQTEEILQKEGFGELNEHNLNIVTRPSYGEEMDLVSKLRVLLSHAYEVDKDEVDQWFAEAYFTGNLLQLFKKLRAVTDGDFVEKIMHLNKLSDVDPEELREIEFKLHGYLSKYDTNIHDTITDEN